MTQTLQEYADANLEELGLGRYKQPLKTVKEAFAANGWELVIDPENGPKFPEGLLRCKPAHAVLEYYMPETGAFVRDVTGPLGTHDCAAIDGVDEPELRVDAEYGEMPVAYIVGVREANDPKGETFRQFATQDAMTTYVLRANNDLEQMLAAFFGGRGLPVLGADDDEGDLGDEAQA